MKLLILCLGIFTFHFASAETVAVFTTSVGVIKAKLLTKAAPKTVENFVKLAKGEQRFIDKDGKKALRPFYNGLIFHRAHPSLGIFSGCQWGTGRGWPGYYLFDEAFQNSNFEKEGLLAMAKLPGDNRVGSQFFITSSHHNKHLNGKYTIFGEVISGMNVVKDIANTRTDSTMKPLKEIKLESVVIQEQ